MCYADKLIVMPEHATLAPPICRLTGEVLSIGRRVTQKGVLEAGIADCAALGAKIEGCIFLSSFGI